LLYLIHEVEHDCW